MPCEVVPTVLNSCTYKFPFLLISVPNVLILFECIGLCFDYQILCAHCIHRITKKNLREFIVEWASISISTWRVHRCIISALFRLFYSWLSGCSKLWKVYANCWGTCMRSFLRLLSRHLFYATFRSRPYASPSWVWVVFRPAQVSEVSAPTSGIHFWTLHTRSFILIWTLHWCKDGTMAIGQPQFTQLSVLGATPLPMRGVVCWPSQVSGGFAQTSELHFWALHTRSFLFL